MRKQFLTLALVSMSSFLFAQNDATEKTDDSKSSKYEVLTNRFGSNWFISANGGVQVLFGDFDQEGKFGNRIAPAIDVSVGKWFTPGLGLRVTYSGLQAKGFNNQRNEYSYGEMVDGYHKEIWNYMNIHGDVLFNLTNMFCGYKEDRVYNAIPYVGFGLVHSFDMSDKNNFGLNVGFLNTFRLNKRWDFNLEAKALITNDNFDLVQGGKKADVMLGVTAGFTYKFSSNGFRKPAKPAPVKQIISEFELKELRDAIAAQAMENSELKEQLKKQPVVVEKVEKTKDIPAPRAVFFNLGSSVVSPQEIVNLGFQADQMKEHPGLKYVVTGYADAATGSAEVNRRISLKRAEAVINALVEHYGIDRASMRPEAFGGSTMFAKDYLNRTVIIKAE